MAAPRQLDRTRHHRGQRHEIEPVVFEDRFERTGIAAAQESEEARRNLEPTDIAHASHLEQRAFERRQPAAAFVPAPDALVHARAAARDAACRNAARSSSGI